MRTNPIEKLGILFWIVLPIAMLAFVEGTTTEYILFGSYVVAIALSIADIFIINKVLTFFALTSWAIFFLFGLTLEKPEAYPLLAEILHLQEAYPGRSYIFGGIAVISAIILIVSIGEEVTVKEKKKEKKE